MRLVILERGRIALALGALAFAVVAGFASAVVVVPITLYAPVFGPPSHINMPEIPLVPLAAGVALGAAVAVLTRTTTLAQGAWRGLTIGFFAALYRGLVGAAVLLFHDPYFTLPYRAYALAMVALVTTAACWWLWRVARGRQRGPADPALASWPLLATIGVTALATIAARDVAPAGSAAIAGLAGILLAERGFEPPRPSARSSLGLLAVLAFGLRAVFGLQSLARTGPGAAFAAASDDGPSYFAYASALVGDPGTITQILTANDGFPPAYSLFLAAILAATHGSLAAAVVIQAVLGGIATILVYLLGCRFGGTVVGLLSAGLYATELNLVQNGSTLTPEAILMPTMLFAFWAFERARTSGRARWLVAAGLAVGFAFVTRNNVGGLLLVVGGGWLLVTGRRHLLRAVAGAAGLALLVLVFSLPVAVATARAEGAPRLTNQLAAVTFEVAGNDSITIENAFLIERGINPFRDPVESLRRFAADPLPVLGFFARAVPQRISTLLFFAPSGAADPVAIVNPTQYPNTFGQLLEVALVLALAITVGRSAVGRPWMRDPLAGLLIAFLVVYVGLFAFVFAPSHGFRYRIPIEPIIFIAEAAGLVVLARATGRAWTAPVAAREAAPR